MTILCGIDFSENSSRAALAAAALAKKFGEPLRLVHVFAPLPGVAPGTAPLALEDATQLEASKLRERFAIEVSGAVVSGVPEDVLRELAREASTRLVVVSALGAKLHRGWLLGSVAERLTQASPVPVLVVRDAHALVRWASGGRPLRVMLGAALDTTSRIALNWALSLREVGPCDLTIAQIASPSLEQTRLGEVTIASMDRLRPEIEALLLRDLRAWAGNLTGAGETRFVVIPGWGRRDTHLTLLAAELEAELLVVGSHQRNGVARLWQGSTSRGAVHHAPSNVVCVPAGVASMSDATLAQFRSVLVPTDLSPLANRAIPLAFGLVAPGGAVHLLNVHGTDAQEQAAICERLRALVPRAAISRGIHTDVHVVTDAHAATAIRHAAARLGVDAICMATHGHSAATDVLLGSQAIEVVRRARLPVVLVPPERE
jgi:nucleotide-binding universal stress UspA family protein